MGKVWFLLISVGQGGRN